MMTSDPPAAEAGAESAEYSPHRPRRHPSREHHSHGPRRRLRGAFFALAALWGFVAGAVAVAAGVVVSGGDIEWNGAAVATVIAGAAVAGGGGWLSSKAYSDIRHRD